MIKDVIDQVKKQEERCKLWGIQTYYPDQMIKDLIDEFDRLQIERDEYRDGYGQYVERFNEAINEINELKAENKQLNSIVKNIKEIVG